MALELVENVKGGEGGGEGCVGSRQGDQWDGDAGGRKVEVVIAPTAVNHPP
jgi:hypothetical protein